MDLPFSLQLWYYSLKPFSNSYGDCIVMIPSPPVLYSFTNFAKGFKKTLFLTSSYILHSEYSK